MSLLGTVAAAVTFAITENPKFALIAYSVGSGIDAYNNQPDRIGPRLDDLRTQMSVYGAPIPFEYGCNRHAGTVIWPQQLEAVEHEHSESAKGGPEQKSFTYTMSLAVLVCEGPIAGIRRIWANKKLIYDVSVANEGATMDPAIGSIRVYNGTETQEVDPLIEATDGASPAYLGYAYVVFEDYDVTEMNGRPPQFEFEVMTSASASTNEPENLGAGGMTTIVTDPDTGEKTVCTTYGLSAYLYDPETGDLLQTIGLPSNGYSITADDTGGFWIGHSESGLVSGNCATHIVRQIDGSFAVDDTIDFGYSGSISKLGTVVWNAARGGVYGFVNNGVGSGAIFQPSPGGAPSDSSITVPDWVFHSLEMPDIDRIALAGYGNWLVIASGSSDSTLHTIFNGAWASTIQGHRLCYDQARGLIYWAVTEAGGVYKVDLEAGTATLLIDIDPVEGLFYDVNADQILVDSVGDQLVYTPDGELVTTRVGFGVLSGLERGVSVPYDENFYFESEAGVLWKMPLGGRLAPNQIPLSEIVADICYRAGLEASDINVSQLTDMVRGYIVPRQMTARAAIEPLQQAFYFDAVESDDKIKFVKRGSATTTTIPADDRAAHEPGQEVPATVDVRRAFETELPIQCDVEYPDIDADHQIGNQYDRRITKDTKHRVNLQLAIVMNAIKAKQVARTTLYQAWQNNSFRWTTTRKYSYLEPTDIVSLPTDEAIYRARITSRRDQPNGIIEWEGIQESVEVYSQSGADGVTPPYSPQTVFEPSTTVLELLDVPILRDEDQNKGIYIAMCGTTSSWPGAEVFRSEDDGSTYNSVLVHSTKAAIGEATTVLDNFTGGNVFDEGNTVTVQMKGGATLGSYTETQVLNGAGIFALGSADRWEILHYKTATLISTGVYELSGLLRGRRGTEWAMSGHAAGDVFVLGSETAWRLYNVPARDLNTERLYKAPAFRTRISDAAAESFTDRAARRRPYSVANLKAEPLNDGGFYVSWAHRSLVDGEWSSGHDVALDTTFTTFNVTFSTIDGDVRKSYSTTSEFYGYSAAQIATDFGGTPPVIKIRVAQNNSDYGDGVGVSIRTDNQTPIYDIPAPDSPDFEPPPIVSPIDGIDPANPVFPTGNQYFGNDWGSPCLWDGSRFIAPDVYQVAIEAGGPVWTSTDGLNFTQLASTNLVFPAHMLAFDGTTYVVCPHDSYGLKNWYSTDLQNWTECTYDAYPSGMDGNLTANRINKVLYIGGRFIALTEGGEIMSSIAGHNWQHKCNISAAGAYTADLQVHISPIIGAAESFAYGGGVYVVVGYNFGGNIFYSANHDGPYTALDINPTVAYDTYSPYLHDVIFDDGYFYAVGDRSYHFTTGGYFVSTPVILKSSDGATWTDISPAPTLAADLYKGNSAMRIFALTSGRLIVIGENADYYSDDAGATWTLSSRLDPNESGYDPVTREFKGAIDRILGGATNGSIVAAREMYFKPRYQSYAGQTYRYLDSYFKPITYDGDDYTPDLFTPYVP